MRCVYPACNVADDLQDITFYSFPEEGFLRTAWLEALGKIGWILEEDSVVCSKHFLTEDFLLTRNGQKLRLNAVPINVQVCRICFARNCKLYPMKDDKQLALSRPSYALAYETLTGLSIDQEDKLPPYLCVKCAHQLLKCVRFRSKSIRAHSILMDILNDYGHVSIETIEAASSSYNAHSSDLNNKTYSDSTTCTTDEQDLDQEHVTYTIKAESVDIVDNDIVPNVKSIRDKGITTHLQDCYITNVVKLEIDNVGNGNIENHDKDHSPAPCEVIANNRASDDTIFHNGLNKKDKNRDSNDNSKSDSSRCSKKARKDISTNKNDINLNNDKVHRESDRVRNINNGNMNIETKSAVEKCNDKVTKQFNLSFKGKDSSLNKSRNLSMKTTQKENLAQITAKDAKANLRIYDTKLEAVGNGGILLSFKLLSCDICKYQTVSNVKLMQHLKDHSASKVYNCSRCYFLTNSKKSLQFHTKTHCDINKHTCKICKKTFTFKNDLKTHERVHTGEKPFSCNVCKKKFSQQNQLRAHLRIHTGERPYSCNVCKKSFRQAGQLQNHMRIHSGEKPYSCDLCNKSFIQRGQLQNHFKRHNNEKPYSCDTCGKHFGLKGTLQNHMRMHTK